MQSRAAIVTQTHLRPQAASGSGTYNLLDSAGARPVADASHVDNLAYVLYTDVFIEVNRKAQRSTDHATGSNFLGAMNAGLPLDRTDVVLATRTIAFGISVFEIFGAL